MNTRSIIYELKRSNWFYWSVCLLVFVWASLFLFQQINLHSADIGRHLKNGELILDGQFDLLYQNTYSYTNSDFPVVTHHWLAGVIFFVIFQMVGWSGLICFYAVLHGLAVVALVLSAPDRLQSWLRLAVSFMVIPLFAIRFELRPEGFSYLFFSIFISLMELYRSRIISYRWLFGLIPLMMIWVNTHIFFVLGLGVVMVYLIDEWIQNRNIPSWNWILLFGLILACLVNPFGVYGALAPLLIFENFGYELVENQTVFFLFERFGGGQYVHFGLLVVCFVGLLVLSLWKRYVGSGIVFFSMCLALLLVGGYVARMMSLFALVSIVGFGLLINQMSELYRWKKNHLFVFCIGIIGVFIGLGLLLSPMYISPFRRTFGLGLLPQTLSAGDFVITNHLEGPLFNNYDNGGYWIYNLFPEIPVFVDNRPEAYPNEFFSDEYIPMQDDSAVWDVMMHRYQFNLIAFYWHDFTPWGQNFITRIVKDEHWIPVYVDQYEVILVRNIEKNSEVIERFGLDRERFSMQRVSR